MVVGVDVNLGAADADTIAAARWAFSGSIGFPLLSLSTQGGTAEHTPPATTTQETERMANIPNANQYRSRNPNGPSSQENRPTNSRHQDPEDVSSGWPAGLGVGIAIGLVLLKTTNPIFAVLGTVLSAVTVANLPK